MEMSLAYRQYLPSLALAGHVECFWSWCGDGLPGREERLIPGGRVEVIFNLGDAVPWLMDGPCLPGLALREAHIMGQRDRLFFCRPAGRVWLFGVRFRPGCFGMFSPIPQSLLLNQLMPASEVFGPAIDEVYERLCEAVDDESRVRLIGSWLAAGFVRTGSAVVQGVLGTMRRFDGVTVEAVCEQVGWGYKRMERAFLKEVGYTPKGYSRLVRFNKAMRRLGRAESLTSVGHGCGYYDQAHFIKDFSRFTGMTPGQFRVEENLVAELLVRNQAV